MHYFPKNRERLRLWQQQLGFKVTDETFPNYRICNRHFPDDSYEYHYSRLRRDALPTLFPARSQDADSASGSSDSTAPELLRIKGQAEGSAPDMEMEVVASTSGMQAEAIPSTSGILREIEANKPKTSETAVQSRSVMTQLRQRLKNKEKQLGKLKKLCKQRGHVIKQLSKLSEEAVANSLVNFPSTVQDFILMQLRCGKQTPQGRRWTLNEKILSLVLFKSSPKCYNRLKQMVAMPSKRTLTDLLNKVPLRLGINPQLFSHINECLTEERDKCCVLLFDEMDIKEHLQYNRLEDRICGFADVGDCKQWANRALVFMLQGVARKWKQPVAYYFSHNGCPGHIMQGIIQEVLRATLDSGLDVVATICDMGSTNVSALKQMGASVDTPYIFCGNRRIYTVFDPPHLLKCTASLFRKHNIIIPVPISENKVTMEARISDIRKAYEIDIKSPLVFRSLHKLKEIHFAPGIRAGMKVNIAAQLMSRTVAAFLYTLLSKGDLDQRAIATATFVQQVDCLFDSFNGDKLLPPTGKDVKCAITEDSAHLAYWEEAFAQVHKWTYKRQTKGGSIKQNKPPSQMGWLVSIKALSSIWEYLHCQKGFKFLKPRLFNQDALENLFGAIRGGCGCSDNPTVVQFAASLKTQILNGLSKQALRGTNCEEDSSQLLSNLRNFLSIRDVTETSSTISGNPNLKAASDEVAANIANTVSFGNVESLPVAYVSGFVAKKILEMLDCRLCQKQLLSTPDAVFNAFISYREWSEEKENLQYPSKALVIAIGHSIVLLEEFFDGYYGQPNAEQAISDHLRRTVSMTQVACDNHQELVQQAIIKGICRIGISWWCKRQNTNRSTVRKDARAQGQKVKKFKHE